MVDILKIIESLEEPDLLTKGVSKTIKNKATERKGFLGVMLCALGATITHKNSGTTYFSQFQC